MIRSFLIISATMITMLLNSCSKEESLNEEIIGTWVSLDHVDTLDFISDEAFTKNFYDGLMHPYTYEINRDSIKIQYNGYNFVLTIPSTHHLDILDDLLSMDFSNGSYGMRQQEILFKRSTN